MIPAIAAIVFPLKSLPTVWLYFRFPLSLRMVADSLAARGMIVSHQTIRLSAEKFGRTFANEIRQRSSGRLGDKWHLDEAVVRSVGRSTAVASRRPGRF